MILAIHFMLTAQAGELDVFPLKGDFGPADLEGRDGWVGGYAADPWPMYGDGDDVTSGTDDGAAGSKWGVGDAMDNWLVQSDLVTVGQGGVESNFQNPRLTWPQRFAEQGAIRVRDYDDIISRLDAVPATAQD